MAQEMMLDSWIIDIQNSNSGVDRRSGYYHKTLSSLPFELYTHIMGADALDATQDSRELHLPGYGTIRHFEGVAVLEKRCYMLLCITDSELLFFSMGSDAGGVPNSAAQKYHQRCEAKRTALRKVDRMARQVEEVKRVAGDSRGRPVDRGKFGMITNLMAACGAVPLTTQARGKNPDAALQKATDAHSRAREKLRALDREGAKPRDRFNLGHITYVALQMDGKDNALLWSADSCNWVDNNFVRGGAIGSRGVSLHHGRPIELLIEARLSDANNVRNTFNAEEHPHELKSYRVALVERHSRLPIILHAWWNRCLVLRAGGLPPDMLVHRASNLDSAVQFVAAATNKIKACNDEWEQLSEQCDLLKELEMEALADPTLKAVFFQAHDNKLLVWMIDTVDRFEDLLDAAPGHENRVGLFELLVRIIRCLSCFLMHSETTSSRYGLMDPQPFSLDTLVEVFSQDFNMLFESVQYVQSVKEKLNTTGVGAVHDDGFGSGGMVNYLDDQDDNGSLVSRGSYGEDHGYHDNEYVDPHTMLDFSYAAEKSSAFNGAGVNESQVSTIKRSVAFDFSAVNNTTIIPQLHNSRPSRAEAGTDPLSNRRRSNINADHMEFSDFRSIGRKYSASNDGAEFIKGRKEHPMDVARNAQNKHKTGLKRQQTHKKLTMTQSRSASSFSQTSYTSDGNVDDRHVQVVHHPHGTVSSARAEVGKERVHLVASDRLRKMCPSASETKISSEIIDSQIGLLAILNQTAYHYACANPRNGDVNAIVNPLLTPVQHPTTVQLLVQVVQRVETLVKELCDGYRRSRIDCWLKAVAHAAAEGEDFEATSHSGVATNNVKSKRFATPKRRDNTPPDFFWAGSKFSLLVDLESLADSWIWNREKKCGRVVEAQRMTRKGPRWAKARVLEIIAPKKRDPVYNNTEKTRPESNHDGTMLGGVKVKQREKSVAIGLRYRVKFLEGEAESDDQQEIVILAKQLRPAYTMVNIYDNMDQELEDDMSETNVEAGLFGSDDPASSAFQSPQLPISGDDLQNKSGSPKKTLLPDVRTSASREEDNANSTNQIKRMVTLLTPRSPRTKLSVAKSLDHENVVSILASPQRQKDARSMTRGGYPVRTLSMITGTAEVLESNRREQQISASIRRQKARTPRDGYEAMEQQYPSQPWRVLDFPGMICDERPWPEEWWLQWNERTRRYCMTSLPHDGKDVIAADNDDQFNHFTKEDIDFMCGNEVALYYHTGLLISLIRSDDSLHLLLCHQSQEELRHGIARDGFSDELRQADSDAALRLNLRSIENLGILRKIFENHMRVLDRGPQNHNPGPIKSFD